MKTHFAVKPPFDTTAIAACGRRHEGARRTEDVRRVTCLNCKNQDAFILAKGEADSAAEVAFQAQVPRTVVPDFGRVNDDGVMECFKCGGVLWRERPRSLFSYHYVCSACGTSAHPMTETGMCT